MQYPFPKCAFCAFSWIKGIFFNFSYKGQNKYIYYCIVCIAILVQHQLNTTAMAKSLNPLPSYQSDKAAVPMHTSFISLVKWALALLMSNTWGKQYLQTAKNWTSCTPSLKSWLQFLFNFLFIIFIWQIQNVECHNSLKISLQRRKWLVPWPYRMSWSLPLSSNCTFILWLWFRYIILSVDLTDHFPASAEATTMISQTANRKKKIQKALLPDSQRPIGVVKMKHCIET